MQTAMKRIFIIEDEIVVLKSIVLILKNNNYSISGTASSFQEARQKMQTLKPDLILSDINLDSGKSGLDLMREYGFNRGIPFIFISAFTDDQTIKDADNIEPYSFITKPFTEKQLLLTIKRFFNTLGNQNINAPTSRERIVLKLVSQGYSTKQIAEELTVSFNTIETHRKNLLGKYNAKTMAELVAMAVHQNWI